MIDLPPDLAAALGHAQGTGHVIAISGGGMPYCQGCAASWPAGLADWEREYLASSAYARLSGELAARERATFAAFRRRHAIFAAVVVAAALAGYAAGRLA